MAKCNLNGVSVEEINRNSTNAYAAGIDSGEIYSVEGCYSKSGKPMLRVMGKELRLKDFNNNSFVADGCILYNPPLIKTIVDFCDDSDASIFVVAGTVTTTAPATATTDKVQSKEELQKEKATIQGNFFSLKGKEKEAAEARLAAIETALKA